MGAKRRTTLPAGRFAIVKCGMSANAPALTFNDIDLLFRLCNQLRKHLDRGFETEHDLRYDDVQILWHVAKNVGECRPSTATGADEDLALPAKSKSRVAKLMAAGLLEEDITSHWRDDRRKQLRLSDKGNKELDRLLSNWQHIAGTTFRGLDQDRLSQLSKVLRELGDAPESLRRGFERT